jgi:hypothetical protein
VIIILDIHRSNAEIGESILINRPEVNFIFSKIFAIEDPGYIRRISLKARVIGLPQAPLLPPSNISACSTTIPQSLTVTIGIHSHEIVLNPWMHLAEGALQLSIVTSCSVVDAFPQRSSTYILTGVGQSENQKKRK